MYIGEAGWVEVWRTPEYFQLVELLVNCKRDNTILQLERNSDHPSPRWRQKHILNVILGHHWVEPGANQIAGLHLLERKIFRVSQKYSRLF